MKDALNKPVRTFVHDMINFLAAQACISENPGAAALRKDIKLIANKAKITRNYYRYKILSKIIFGKKRKHYKKKRIEYKLYMRRIRELTK